MEGSLCLRRFDAQRRLCIAKYILKLEGHRVLPSPLSCSSEAHSDRITIRDQSDAEENNKRNVR